MNDIQEASGAALIQATLGGRKIEMFARDIGGASEVKPYAGTSITLKRADNGCLITTTSGSGVAIFVPPSSQTVFPIPAVINVAQLGAGQVTFVAGAGVTINSPETLKLAKQYATGTLICTDTDVWLLVGNLATS
jgi:hypothetical protein